MVQTGMFTGHMDLTRMIIMRTITEAFGGLGSATIIADITMILATGDSQAGERRAFAAGAGSMAVVLAEVMEAAEVMADDAQIY